MTYDNITGSTTAGYCPFSISPGSALKTNFVRLPKSRTELNTATCGMANRDGLLCSKCKPGYGPAVFSFIWMQMCKVLQSTLWLVPVLLCGILTNNSLLDCCCPVSSLHHLCSPEPFCHSLSNDVC